MSKKKKVSAKEKHRRQDQSRKQWEKDNPITAYLLNDLNTSPVYHRNQSIFYS